MIEPEYGTEDARFWAMPAEEQDGHIPVFGEHTYGIVDETKGGIILYCHRNSVDLIIGALRKDTE